MADIRRLTSVEQWEEALKATSAKPLLVFKHSTQCPISAAAHEAWQNYVQDRGSADCDYALVHVIEDRPVSNAIAESLGVQHQSPQAIFVRDGRAEWNESHWRITYDFLAERLGTPSGARS
jgi:bacillithiol system protein YtxJ